MNNLFFVASQADTLNENFNDALQTILEKGSKRLCDSLNSQNIPADYSQLRSRFYAYSIYLSSEALIEKANFLASLKAFFKRYYQKINQQILACSYEALAKVESEYRIISCFKNVADKTHQNKTTEYKLKKFICKTQKRATRRLSKEVIKALKSEKLSVYKRYDISFEAYKTRIRAKSTVFKVCNEFTADFINKLNIDFPCKFYSAPVDISNFLVETDKSITQLPLSPKATRKRVLFKKIPRKAFRKKEIAKEFAPVITTLWNNVSEYILCLYIFSRYSFYNFEHFHCYNLEEIYDSHQKATAVKRILTKIDGCLKNSTTLCDWSN